jgi:L-ribulose-5-phosphate 4-epimerase
MLEKLKAEVCQANLDLVAEGLVIQTWGNASAVDRANGVMVIKPSGVPYAGMKPEHMVAWPGIGGVVHTHSLFATAWAQACKPLLAYGTTQADYWYGDVPCTRKLTAVEIKNDYEANTGEVILETFKKLKFDPLHHPAVLVASHGAFTWGRDAHDAVHNASVLEFIARLNAETLRINPKIKPMQPSLLDKHFLRKHGPKATYGQK